MASSYRIAISSLETFSTETVSVVRLETDDGNTSIGQISPYNTDIATEIFHRQITSYALVEDPARSNDRT